MKIKNHLSNIRNARILHDLIIFFLFLLITSIFVLLIGLLLESVFYFSPEIKTGDNLYSEIQDIKEELTSLKIKLKPTELLMVGDDPKRDIEGANRLGIITMF